MGHFLYNSISKSLKYDTWLLWAISITTPYQNHWNLTYGCSGLFPIQFLIKIIEIWHLAARGNFHYNSLSKSLKRCIWLLWAISFKVCICIKRMEEVAIPFQGGGNAWKPLYFQVFLCSDGHPLPCAWMEEIAIPLFLLYIYIHI